MPDRIAIRGRRQLRRMCSIETNAPHLMSVNIEDQDLILLLDDLDLEFDRQKKRRRLGAALVSRIGEIYASELRIAALLDDLRRFLVEDRIPVIAHAFDGVAKARDVR